MKSRKKMEIGCDYFPSILSGKLTWVPANDVDLETSERISLIVGDQVELHEMNYGATGRVAIVSVTDVSPVPELVYPGPVVNRDEMNIASIRVMHSFLKGKG